MSSPDHIASRTGDDIRIVVLNRGRAKFAREMATKLLQPGEELEPAYQAPGDYGYRVKVVATPVLLTPEERELVIEALESAARTLRINTGGYHPSNIIEANKRASAHDALRKRIQS